MNQSAMGADRSPTGQKEARAEKKAKRMPLYKVLLHNDDFNSMRYVVKVLQEVFAFDPQEARCVMMCAHTTGVALCKVEPLELAELHSEKLTSAGLTATIEPE